MRNTDAHQNTADAFIGPLCTHTHTPKLKLENFLLLAPSTCSTYGKSFCSSTTKKEVIQLCKMVDVTLATRSSL